MKSLSSILELPTVPAVYAIYGGRGRGLYVAYVGVADSLKRRIGQHLIDCNSSITTGTSAVGLNPAYATEVRWWEHPDFTHRHVLEAAELVAFDILNPALKSRGTVKTQVRMYYTDEDFQGRMRSLFEGECTGCLMISTLQDALERIADLEQRPSALEDRLKEE